MGDETDEMQRSWAGVRLDGRVRRRPSDARGRRARARTGARGAGFFKRRERAHREAERCLFAERASQAARERASEIAESGTRDCSAFRCILGVLAREMRVERLSGASRPSRPDPGSVI